MSSSNKVESRLGWLVIGTAWPEEDDPKFKGVVIEEQRSIGRVTVQSTRDISTILGPVSAFQYVRRLTNEELLTHSNGHIREVGAKLSSEA